MMKIVLVYPPIVFGEKRGFGFPPLGVLYLATFLEKRRIDVKVIDSFIEGHTLGELTEAIQKENPDVVCFSAMTCQIRNVLAVAEELKRINPSLKIVIGGSHISSTKEEVFNFSENVDFLIYGEGENSLYNLVNALEKNLSVGDIDGLIYKKNEGVRVNKPPELIRNLDELPFPNLDFIDIKKYDSYYARSLPLTSLIASRGCPFNCTFCDAYATHGKILRFRTPKNIVDEMEYDYRKYKIKQFMIKDSTFTVNKKWIYDICSEIKNRNLKIDWTCNTRVDMVDESLLKIMKKSGCYMIMFGIESGSQKVLDMLRKGITIQQIRDTIYLRKKAGLETTGYFMVGNPGETEEDAQKTVRFSKELGLDMATFGVTVAYPGTELYDWAVENKVINRFWYMGNIKVSKSIREMDGNLNLDGFCPERQLSIVKKANREFYLRPSFVLKNILKIRNFYSVKRNLKSIKELL